MADDLIVRAMICACFKHPLHSTAILRRTCLGCSCASSVVSECFDSACRCLPSNVRQFTPVARADLMPRLWTRLTANFQNAFIDLLHECCSMGLGELPRMSVSMIAAFCALAPSEYAVSASLLKLLAILRSPDFLSVHAAPCVAAALLHAAICYRSEPALAVACCRTAAAVVDACCSGGACSWPADHDGSTVALAWCAAHIFAESEAEGRGASIACGAMWSKLHHAGIIATQAAALLSIPHRPGARPLSLTQRLVRVLDALPPPQLPAEGADAAIPWPLRHHLSWIVHVERELLLKQLVTVWISRSSFRPLWVLQCVMQSPGDPVRYSALLPCPALRHPLFPGGGPSLVWFCCTLRQSRVLRRCAAPVACCCSLPWALSLIPLQIEMLSSFSAPWSKVMLLLLMLLRLLHPC